jgi:hypothetical protein
VSPKNEEDSKDCQSLRIIKSSTESENFMGALKNEGDQDKVSKFLWIHNLRQEDPIFARVEIEGHFV